MDKIQLCVKRDRILSCILVFSSTLSIARMQVCKISIYYHLFTRSIIFQGAATLCLNLLRWYCQDIERDVFHVKLQEVDSVEVRIIKLTGNESVSIDNFGISWASFKSQTLRLKGNKRNWSLPSICTTHL